MIEEFAAPFGNLPGTAACRAATLPGAFLMGGNSSLFGRFNSLFGQLGNWLRKCLMCPATASASLAFLVSISMFCQ
jgi:hypothetical protein